MGEHGCPVDEVRFMLMKSYGKEPGLVEKYYPSS
jgi:hypothetical protein